MFAAACLGFAAGNLASIRLEQMENWGESRGENECGARRKLPRVIVSGMIKFDANASVSCRDREPQCDCFAGMTIRCCFKLTLKIPWG